MEFCGVLQCAIQKLISLISSRSPDIPKNPPSKACASSLSLDAPDITQTIRSISEVYSSSYIDSAVHEKPLAV